MLRPLTPMSQEAVILACSPPSRGALCTTIMGLTVLSTRVSFKSSQDHPIGGTRASFTSSRDRPGFNRGHQGKFMDIPGRQAYHLWYTPWDSNPDIP